MSTTRAEADRHWPPDPNLPLEERYQILVEVIDGILALLPLGMIDTLRCSIERERCLMDRVTRIEEHLALTSQRASPAERNASIFTDCSAENPCCARRGEYNGFASGPLLFVCPKHCGCHD